jgi:hypothetical protein
VFVLLAVEHFDLFLFAGVTQANPQHEAVELGLRQREGALILDGVLRRQHHERRFERIGAPVHRHLPLFHGLQQRRLGFGRGAVDLIHQDDLGVDGAGAKFELAGLLVEHGYAGHVAGQHVGRELDALEFAANRSRQRLRQDGLAHAGHVLDQDVALAQQA